MKKAYAQLELNPNSRCNCGMRAHQVEATHAI
jgi:hypothetical protein